jgi:hypothetical protein
VRASTVSRMRHGARRAGRVLCGPTSMEPRPLWGSRAMFAVWAKPNSGCQACHARLSHARQSPCAYRRLRAHRVVRGLRVREARGLASWDACVAPPRVLWGRLPGQGPPAALSASTHGWAGGVRRCSVSTRCRTGTPGRWAGTRRGDAGADIHTSSTQTPMKRAVFLGRGACHTPERCCCTWRGQRASARGGQAPWDPFAPCGGRSYGLSSGVCPRLCRAHLSQTPGRIEAYACIHTSTSANAKCSYIERPSCVNSWPLGVIQRR